MTDSRWSRLLTSVLVLVGLQIPFAVGTQHPTNRNGTVPLQPFADQIREIGTTLDFLGQPLAKHDQQSINEALGSSDPSSAVSRIEAILDKYTLVTVSINAESRVDAKRGGAPAELIQDGARIFLVKVINRAGVTSVLRVNSPNNGPVYVTSTGSPSPNETIKPDNVHERWAEISLYDQSPPAGGYGGLPERLSGLGLEYRLLVIYSRDTGQRSAKLAFDVGQGTQDLGFLNEINILFNAAPARSIKLHVLNENGQRTMASFVFKDNVGRIYPNPAKRLAPDFYFQPQIYRADGEWISLPPGSYAVTYTGGPEYITERRDFRVDAHGPEELSFRLKRWIDPTRYGWYSGDHHIHAAGCSHYESPSEGVGPDDMDRQVRGEHLNVGCVLTWGPCYYYQKRFFRGRQDDPRSRPSELLHYDLEVSGFPSSHSGHLVLLDLKEQDYPGTKRIEDWPTWDLPILRWAKSQGAIAGFAHSGWGLQVKTDKLPNYEIPGFDGIGANEYIVDVTFPGVVDFISAGDTPSVWELNIWYQTLNVGFRTRISGETDFPCIYDTRVGEGRSYATVDGPLTYENFANAIRDGRTYVSDGRSHLMDFTVNGVELGKQGSHVSIQSPGTVKVEVNAAAYLDPEPDPKFAGLRYDQKPYWNLERARIGQSRTVPVEAIVNAVPVARKDIVADGRNQKLVFELPIRCSSWIALRILPSSHTNPMFVSVGGQSQQPLCSSVQWCLDGVNQCWTQKAPKISPQDMPEAERAYEHAREFYKKLLGECASDVQTAGWPH
jgi:hypothetical protein